MLFLHAADVHLDTPFAGRSSQLRTRLKDASREALCGLVDLALSEEVDAVILAGDLFDGDRVTFQTEQYLLEQLHRLNAAHIPVVYATGNHDPGTPRGRAMQLDWPPNVTIVSGAEPVCVNVTDGDGEVIGRITAVGHATASESRDLSQGFPKPTGDVLEIAMLHTQVGTASAADGHGSYAPSTLEGLVSAGYDYWALGHVHLRQCLSDYPAVHYPGNTQGRNPKEEGPKGVLLVRAERGVAPEVEFRELAPVCWASLRPASLAEVQTVEQLLKLLETVWHERSSDGHAPTPGVEWLLRVYLGGATPLWVELGEDENRAHLEAELKSRLGVLGVQVKIGDVHPVVEVGDFVDRQDSLGAALRLIQAVRGGEAQLNALNPDDLVDAPSEGPLAAYVARLLDGAEDRLVARALKGTVK